MTIYLDEIDNEMIKYAIQLNQVINPIVKRIECTSQDVTQKIEDTIIKDSEFKNCQSVEFYSRMSY